MSHSEEYIVHFGFLPNENNKFILVTRKRIDLLVMKHQGEIFTKQIFTITNSYLTSFSWLDNRKVFLGDELGFIRIFDIKTGEINHEILVNADIKKKEQEKVESDNLKIPIEHSITENYQKREMHLNRFYTKEIISECQIRQVMNLVNGFVCVFGHKKIAFYFLNNFGGYLIENFIELPQERAS